MFQQDSGITKYAAGDALIPLIINDTYREFPDGRQICLPNKKGREEYKRRREAMADRQRWICACGCGRKMWSYSGDFQSVTFQHTDLRGKDIDERIEKPDPDHPGKMLCINSAMRHECNIRLGSQRTSVESTPTTTPSHVQRSGVDESSNP